MKIYALVVFFTIQIFLSFSVFAQDNNQTADENFLTSEKNVCTALPEETTCGISVSWYYDGEEAPCLVLSLIHI